MYARESTKVTTTRESRVSSATMTTAATVSAPSIGVWNSHNDYNQTKHHDQEDFFHSTLLQPITFSWTAPNLC